MSRHFRTGDNAMKKVPVLNPNRKHKAARLFASVAALLLLAGWVVLFQPGYGIVQSASAQVNIQKVGEAVTETVGEAAGQSAQNLAGGEPSAPEQGEESAAGPEGIVLNPPENVPGESAELAPEEETKVYDTGPGSMYYIDCSMVGGPSIVDLDAETLRAQIAQIETVASAPEPARTAMIDTLFPILRRFQDMVSPPWDIKSLKEGESPPWLLADSRRYSPFDVVGGGGPPAAAGKPVPPFPPLEQVGGQQPQVTSAQVASALRLVGVVGEPGSYLAVLRGPGGEELRLGVGDEVTRQGDAVFIVTDISLAAVRIANRARPNDQALVQFVSREGIADMSISY